MFRKNSNILRRSSLIYKRPGSENENTPIKQREIAAEEEQKAEVVPNTVFNQIGYYITELFQCTGCCCGTTHERHGVSNMKQSHMEMKFHDDELQSSSPETQNENFESFVMLSQEDIPISLANDSKPEFLVAQQNLLKYRNRYSNMDTSK